MTTEYKLNTYIEWTDEDRAKGECPVPKGSDVTLWLSDMDPYRPTDVTAYDWGDCERDITAYLIHSVPREPIVVWRLLGGSMLIEHFESKEEAEECQRKYGGRVVKLVEETE